MNLKRNTNIMFHILHILQKKHIKLSSHGYMGFKHTGNKTLFAAGKIPTITFPKIQIGGYGNHILH